jgi:hypothetical protein
VINRQKLALDRLLENAVAKALGLPEPWPTHNTKGK